MTYTIPTRTAIQKRVQAFSDDNNLGLTRSRVTALAKKIQWLCQREEPEVAMATVLNVELLMMPTEYAGADHRGTAARARHTSGGTSDGTLARRTIGEGY